MYYWHVRFQYQGALVFSERDLSGEAFLEFESFVFRW